MNYTTAVFLINNKVRAIMATYEGDDTNKNLRTMFKTLDQTIQVGDFIVVPTNTRHGMTVNKVVEVDVSVDFDSDKPVTWVVAKLDLGAYTKTMAQEDTAVMTIKSAEVRRKRDELRASLIKDSEAIAALQLCDSSSDTPTTPPPFVPPAASTTADAKPSESATVVGED